MMAKAMEDLTVKETVKKIEDVINDNPGPIEGVQAVYQYDIPDEDYSFQLHLKDGKAEVKEEYTERGDCTIIISYPNFKKMLLGKLNGTAAFMMGKLKVKGDIGKALKVEALLGQYNMEAEFRKS
ncbi:SCP2 sterol-binding domain-containing protein [Fictibacillus enclensis]|uniref:SCP2 sterol-binding domain-containing protein n=1 Tax=Fictibacillus enclensis TaxID=1017270 RepID=UPI0024C0CFDD|nr:SCP2 sterol-binding domain-containing protein [Fictibacillus enclensis]WHY73025.1 SCP2 sterol-binding domain-containing protein [Fictibacillus enclensis]